MPWINPNNNDEGTTQTQFNSSVAKLQRIDKLHQECHIARIKEEFKVWFNSLLALTTELSEKLSKDDQKEIEKQIEKVMDEQSKNQKTNKYMLELHYLEITLFKFENKYGMGITNKEDDDFGDSDW